jgi:transposase, IS5 family
VDATLIAAAIKKPSYGGGGVNPRDPDARMTMKRRRAHFGYKAHLAVDEGSGARPNADPTAIRGKATRPSRGQLRAPPSRSTADPQPL